MSKTCIKSCLLMATVLFCLFFMATPTEAQEPTYRLGATIGLDLAGGPKNGKDFYNWITSYGFSDVGIQFNVPPSAPSVWQTWKTFLKDLIYASETDGVYGQKCRIFWILGCHNGLTATEWLGAIDDMLSTIGPNHWSFMGGYIRGEFIYRQVPIPPTLAELKAQWLNVKAKFNKYGYNWGVWAGLGPLADKFPELKTPTGISSFIEGPIVSVSSVSKNPDNTKGTQWTYEAFSKEPLQYPTNIATVALGMWDDRWFVPNTDPYYVTYEKLEAAFRGYSEAYVKDPNKCQTLFWYVTRALFDPACPYLTWWSQFCTTYNVRVYSSPPPAFTPPPPIPVPPYPFPPYPVCQECTVTPAINRGNVGGGVNPIMYPGDTFRISGRSINLANGIGLAGKTINFYVQKPGSLVGELYGSGITDSAGRFNIQGLVAPSIEGQWYCYTKYEGDPEYLSGESIRETFYIQTIGPTYKLNVASSPVSGVSFTLDGTSYVTPYSTSMYEGAHTITMPDSTVIGGRFYNFKNWEDGSTNPTRVINLVSDISITAYYEENITLASYPDPLVSSNGLLNHTIIIPSSTPHAPCGAAHTMDVLGAILIAEKLGLSADGGTPAANMDDYTATYDSATGTVTILDTNNNLITVGGPGVNMITWHYNNLLDATGNHTLLAYFLKDDVGVDYIYTEPTRSTYYIEYDAKGRKIADYAIIELYHDQTWGRWILIVAGLGGEGTWAAAKVLSTYEDWNLSGMVALVKYYDSDGDGYLDTITILETVGASFTQSSALPTLKIRSLSVDAFIVDMPPLLTNVILAICFASPIPLSLSTHLKRNRKVLICATLIPLILGALNQQIVMADIQYMLSDYPRPFISSTNILNSTMIVASSDGHGPCGGAHTMDVMVAVIIAGKLGLYADGGTPAANMDDYTATYDSATGTVTILDTNNNLITVGGPGVNMITWHYNNLLDATGNHTLKAYFEKDENGTDRIHVAPSGNNYYIESDAQGRKKADYAIIELYYEESYGRWILIIAGLGGEGTWAAAKVLFTFEDWYLSGQAAIVEYYDGNGDGYLDTITIVETI